MDFLLGVDGGGTGCRAALATASGEIVGRGRSGPANIRTDLTGARDNIVAAAREAATMAGLDTDVIGGLRAILGLAGANVGDYGRQLENILPFAKSRVVSDALIALEGAVGDGGDGAIAIVGTGTAYLIRRGGVERPLGGWGFQVGDQGAGSRIGREVLEEALLAYDGVRPASPLSDAILASFGNDPHAIVGFSLGAKPGDFGNFAPKALEYAARGDAIAGEILARAVAAIEASLSALGVDQDTPLSLLGGLSQFYAENLSEPFRTLVRQPRTDALGGAVSMAVRTFGIME